MILKKNLKTHVIRTKCILCNSNKFENILPLYNSRLADLYLKRPFEKIRLDKTYDFSVYMCKKCSHLQLKTIINKEYTWNNYFLKLEKK